MNDPKSLTGTVPDEILYEMATNNNVIDNMTREVLHNIVESPSYNPQEYMITNNWPMYWYPNKETLEYYKFLITG